MELPRQARGVFTVDTQVATPAAWDGGATSHTRVVKTFTGEMAGSGVVESIMILENHAFVLDYDLDG